MACINNLFFKLSIDIEFYESWNANMVERLF